MANHYLHERMFSILLLTIIACVEKLDEKDDIIMACVDVPVHYVVTIIGHRCHGSLHV